MLTLALPLPPSLNNAYASFNGNRIPSRQLKAWKKAAKALVIEQWEQQGRPAISKPYALHYRINVNHQSDIGNREKCATDLLVATIPGFPDDKWVNRITIERDRSIDGAIVVVEALEV